MDAPRRRDLPDDAAPMVDLARVRVPIRWRCASYPRRRQLRRQYQRADDEMLALWAGRRSRRPARCCTGPWPSRARASILIWGAGAIGGTLGACLARAGTTSRWSTRWPSTSTRSTPRGLRDHRTDRRVHARRARPSRQHVDRHVGPRSCSPPRRITPTARRRALAPHLAADGCVVSAQNGLNELAIAEVVGAARTVGASSTSAPTTSSPGAIHYGGRGAVVVGEIDGRITPRVKALARRCSAASTRARW